MHCDKVAYPSKREAQTAANLRFKQDHVKLRLYECPDCKAWHLTKILETDYRLQRGVRLKHFNQFKKYIK